MNDNDTSDEAMARFILDHGPHGIIQSDLIEETWQECHRRCEAQIEQRERRAFEAGMRAALEGDLEPSLEFISEAYQVFNKNTKPR